MFAVVRTGGKQYRVEEGRSIRIDRVAGDPGDQIQVGEVLMLGSGADVTVGAPTVEGARIFGTIFEQGRARKIVVFRYKNKTRSRKKTGHRQHFTRVRIDDILAKGQEPRPQKERTVAAAPAVEEAAPKPARRTRKAEPAIAVATEPEPVAETPKARAKPAAKKTATTKPAAKRARKKAE